MTLVPSFQRRGAILDYWAGFAWSRGIERRTSFAALPLVWWIVALQPCLKEVVVLGAAQIMYQVFSGQKPPLNREGMPKAYEELIEECWHDDPDARPTFAAILLRLREMYSQERQRLFSLSQANGAVAS